MAEEISAPSLDSIGAEEDSTSSSSRGSIPVNPKILQDLESMKSMYNRNLVMST